MRWKLTLIVLILSLGDTFGQFTNTYPVTRKLSWDTTIDFDSYQYDGGSGNMWFRLMEPNGFEQGNNGGAKFPLIVFFHGAGEKGTDNDKQLVHGGQIHRDAVKNNVFPGLLLYPQIRTTDGNWFSTELNRVRAVIQKLISDYDVDPTRIYIHGLSMGGGGTWRFLAANPLLVATAYPMADAGYLAPAFPVTDPKYKYTPLWYSQGGKDATSYALPQHANITVSSFRNTVGGEIRYLYFPDLGHGVWNATYAKSDFFTNMLSKSKLYIVAEGGQTSFCQGATINVRLGITPGFQSYEWKYSPTPNPDWNSLPVSGTTNSIVATAVGYYSVRFRYLNQDLWGPFKNTWSTWATPVWINDQKELSPTPSINSGGKSVNLPALDGSTSVSLYAENPADNYQWYRGATPTVKTNPYPNINQAGSYTLQTWTNAGPATFNDTKNTYIGHESVPVEYRPAPVGCPSLPSNAIGVSNPNVAGVPNAPNNFFVTTIAPDKIKITWDDQANDELGFEIYRSQLPGGPYTLITTPTTPDTDMANNPQGYTSIGLTPNTTYYYRMRAVNNRGGSAYTPEMAATTDADTTPPTPPILSVISTSHLSISLAWAGASDNVGIKEYQIWRNGSLAVTVPGDQSKYTITSGLTPETFYTFYIVAVDVGDLESIRSNIVSAATINTGLNYEFYTVSGISSVDQIVSNGTLVKQGIVDNFDISVRTQNDNFGFVFTGYINIPATGSYTFYTTSDDGSKLFIDDIQRVNNDGLHGSQERSSSAFTLSSGWHAIRVLFFEAGGGEVLEVRWQGPGISKALIPSSAFKSATNPAPTKPMGAPGLSATAISGSRIDLAWTDSPTETEYEILQSTSYTGGYSVIAIKNTNATSHSVTNLLPLTPYFYKIVSTNSNGSSGILNSTYKAFLDFENNLNDGSPNAITSNISSGSPSYNTDAALGTRSIVFTGTGQYIDLDAGNNFIHNAFTQRTVSFWFKMAGTTDNQILFDEGSSTDGFGIRYFGGKIQGVVQNNNSLKTISSTTSPGTSSWIHVVFMFNSGKLELYINGVLEASSTATYSSVRAHSDGSGIGARNGSTAFDSNGNGFNGKIDGFYIYNGALTAEEINALYSKSIVASATTLNPELPPAAPTALNATLGAGPVINLTWTDNAIAPNNETGYEVERSLNAGAFSSLVLLGADVTTYTDNTVSGNKTYTYRVRALGAQQNSGYSNTATLAIPNTLPVISPISNRTVAVGGIITFNIDATDADGDVITLSQTGMPSFGTFTQGGGVGQFTFDATGQPVASYPISVVASDGVGTSNTSFTLNVTATNNNPVLDPISVSPMPEGALQTVNISATDSDSPIVTFSVENLPTFGVLTVTGNKTAQILFSPGFADAGTYSNIKVIAMDDAGGRGESSFNLTVNNFDPAVAPTSLIATTQGPSSIKLDWTDNSTDETGFKVYRSLNSNGPYSEITTLGANSLTFTNNTGLTSNTIYYYKVTAYKSTVESESNIAFAQTANNNPVFSPTVPDVYVLAGTSREINISTTDVENNPRSLSGSNLPDFVSILDNGNGTGKLLVAPTITDIGIYKNVKVKVMDSYNGATSESIFITVGDPQYTHALYVNFGNNPGASEPWNNTSGLNTLNNLEFADGSPSTISMQNVSGWGTSSDTGFKEPDNEGIYDSAVIKSSWKTITSTPGIISFSGLTSSYYNITIFGSDKTVTTTTYTINSVSQTINPLNNNSSVTIGFNGIAPTGNQIQIDVFNSGNIGVISAIILEGYNIIPAPTNFIASGIDINTIGLSWEDNSGNEDAFEIWRRQMPNGTMAPYDINVSANSVSFSDGGLSAPNNTFEYQVRARVGGNYSAFTPAVVASTLDALVQVNFDDKASHKILPSLSDWNTTGVAPLSGLSWNDLKNVLAAEPTSIDLVNDLYEIGGSGAAGFLPGLYPDSVQQTFYFLDKTNSSQWRLSGLSDTQLYDISFFGSVTSGALAFFTAEGITDFEINGKVLVLNTEDNANKIVQFSKVAPNANGDIEFFIRPNAEGAGNNYAVVNAMIIKSYRNPETLDQNATFYTVAESDISVASNWNSSPSGAGTALTDFTGEGDQMIIQSDQELTITANALAINGLNTFVKVTGNAKITVAPAITSLSFFGLEIDENVTLQISASAPLQINVGNGGMVINNGATLDIGTSTLVVNGSSGLNTNNQLGSIATNKGNISISSSSALSSHLVLDESNNEVNNLTVNFTEAGQLNLESTMDLTGILKMQAGILNTKDNLVMVHNVTDLALIDKVEDGASIIGQVDYHRYWDRIGSSTAYGAYHFGVPVKDQTLMDWNSDFYIQGTNFTFGNYSNISAFDETLFKYNALKNGTDEVTPGKGYSVFIFEQELYDGIVTYNNIGEPVIGDGEDGTMTADEKFSFPLTYTVQATPDITKQGWNLIANPYPCIINLDELDWAGSSGVFNTVYIYDSKNFDYISYVNGGPGNTKNLLLPGQGFFVKAQAATPVLKISENAKVTDEKNSDLSDPSVFRTGEIQDVVSLELTDFNGKSDRTYLKFHEEATEGIDLKYDAPLFGNRLISTTELTGIQQLFVNALPKSKLKGIVPLNILTKKAGSYTLNIDGNTYTTGVLLYDNYLNLYSNIGSEESVYTFQINSEVASYLNRFVLILHPTPEIAAMERKSFKNELVSLPLHSKNISEVSDLSMEITWNPSELEFVGLDSMNTLLLESDFDISQTSVGLLKVNRKNEYQPLSDLVQLFNIKFKPLVAGVESEISITNAVAHIKNTHEFDLSILTKNGTIKVYDEKMHQGIVSYKGKRSFKHGKLKLMPDATILETNSTGEFEMYLKENIQYSLHPESTEYNDFRLNIHDLVGLNRHLIHVNEFQKRIDYLAADISENGMVEQNDKQELQDLILTNMVGGNEHTNRKWVSSFQSGSNERPSSEAVLPVNNVFMFGYENPTLYVSVLGDVSDYEYDGFGRVNSYDTAIVRLQPDFTGRNVIYTVSIKSSEDLSGCQFALNWDSEKYGLESIQSFSKGQGYMVNEQKGILALVWTSELEGTSFDEYIPTLQLELRNIDGKFSQQPLSLDQTSLPPVFIDTYLNEIKYAINDGLNLKQNIQLIKNYPNPFTNETNFDFLLNESQDITVTIYNSIGEIVESVTKNYNEGFNRYTWQPKINCAKGIYFYNFSGQNAEATGKVILR